uniref:Uncharacterized protein n=1 Tax=Anguilla anguilla TaxID=7936 RepID=A0A0E9PWL5_ANGAN
MTSEKKANIRHMMFKMLNKSF